MASIIEREAVKPEEKLVIAAVFYKRSRKKMEL
jgi:cell division protein YceG involved in septum cleavage